MEIKISGRNCSIWQVIRGSLVSCKIKYLQRGREQTSNLQMSFSSFRLTHTKVLQGTKQRIKKGKKNHFVWVLWLTLASVQKRCAVLPIMQIVFVSNPPEIRTLKQNTAIGSEMILLTVENRGLIVEVCVNSSSECKLQPNILELHSSFQSMPV